VVSLLDEGNELVVIYPMVETTDPEENSVWRAGDVGVPVMGSVQPIGNDTSTEGGTSQVVDTTYRFRPNRGETVPIGAWARVEWDGRTWDLVGDPGRHNGSDATAHRTYRIKARKAAGT
jgi:hypothetical protein